MFKKNYDYVHWYVSDVGARVVAKTGIPTDRHHIGKMMIHCLKEDPGFIMQIDGATSESETNGSVLDRSIRCAVALKKLGLKKDDVMILMAPNNIHLTIPHNAALFLGIMVAPIDFTLGINELNTVFDKNRPKIVFCDNDERAKAVEQALKLSNLDAEIITFNGSTHKTLKQLLGDVNDEETTNFIPTDFDPEDTVAYLISTSGTTGFPKTAMLTHKNLAIALPYFWQSFINFPNPTKLVILLSPLQWLSAGIHYIYSPILKYTRLQTSAPVTPDHFAQLVNKYKPTYIATSPTQMSSLTTVSDKCDFTCFDCVLLGGSAVSLELLERIKSLIKSPHVYAMYGMSEISGIALYYNAQVPPGTSGRLVGSLEYRLVNMKTQEDVTEPYVHGEMWFKGATVFKGYYNNPEATAEAMTKDGWLRSGDIFYRDEHWNFYFVDRCKLLLKYKNHHVAPVEIEKVIMKHPGVLDVTVTGIPDKECGDLVVACVIPKPGCSPTAQEIKDLVKNSLTDTKQLRGGVIFMKEFPVTSTSKVNRMKLKEMVLTLPRE